jgi:ribosome-associated toxin RatA of RatAB toxin-antitoxin module
MPYREEQTALTYSADELFGVVANIRDYPSLLCPAVLSRHRSACRVDDVRLNAVRYRRTAPRRARGGTA